MAISVDNLAPNLNSDIAPTDPVSFDVTDPDTIDNDFVLVLAYFASTGDYEVVHDGVSGGFAPRYAQGSRRTPIATPDPGYSYVVKRTGGWAETPVLRVIAFTGFVAP